MAERHTWAFKARFRRQAFGWRSQPAIGRIKEAVAEIKQVAKRDPALGAEGAVTLIERLSPALEQVDSSSGAIGMAVHAALTELVMLIAAAPVDTPTRETWLERLWEAYEQDGVPYIESLGDHWGTLCTSTTISSAWADRLMGTVRFAWSPDPNLRGFFRGTANCLSSLVAAERYDEVLALLELAPYPAWSYRQYGFRALAASGETAAAIRYAEEGRGLNDSPIAIARACEQVLLAAGRSDEAYERYGLVANQRGTYLATFRAVLKQYPDKTPRDVLADLAQTTPGEEGKWFAAAKDARLYDEAIALAARTPCDPKTLSRAARDHALTQPPFAVAAGLLALHWLVQGFGYEITSGDVWDAYRNTIRAAEACRDEAGVRERIRQIVAGESADGGFVSRVLGGELAR